MRVLRAVNGLFVGRPCIFVMYCRVIGGATKNTHTSARIHPCANVLDEKCHHAKHDACGGTGKKEEKKKKKFFFCMHQCINKSCKSDMHAINGAHDDLIVPEYPPHRCTGLHPVVFCIES